MIFILLLLLNCTKKFNLLHLEKGVNEDRTISCLKKGDLKLFKVYFSKLEDINFLDEEKNTLLHLAIKYRQEEIQSYLIDKFIDIRIFNKDGKTPEDLTDNIELKKSLKNLRLCQELIDAVKISEESIIKQIIKERSLKEILDHKGNSIIFKMMQFISSQTLNFLIKEQDILNFRDNQGNNIIHILCYYNRLEPLIEILRSEKDIFNHKNKEGKNFLEVALDNKNFELIHLILISIFNNEIKLSPEVLNESFLKKLMKKSTVRIVETLIENNIIENYIINLDNSLKTIISEKYWTVLKYLLSKKEQILDYENIVIDCIKSGSLKLLEKFKENGIDFNIRLRSGNYLIHEDIYNKETLKFILEIFNIDTKNIEGDTILHVIASNKNYPLNLLEYILSMNFELRVNNKGLSCIDIALLNKNTIFIQSFMKFRSSTLSLDIMKSLLKKAIKEDYFSIIHIISLKCEELQNRGSL